MAKNEKSGSKTGSIASKGLQRPGSLTNKEIKSLAASVLTQRPDHKPSKPSKK
jgi:hypothetical protein